MCTGPEPLCGQTKSYEYETVPRLLVWVIIERSGLLHEIQPPQLSLSLLTLGVEPCPPKPEDNRTDNLS